MQTVVLFSVIQTAVSGFAFWKGGPPERIMASMLLVAFVASVYIGAQGQDDFITIAIPILMVDGMLFAGMVGLALKADRYWPLWIAGIHATTLTTHLIKALNPSLLPTVYALAAALSSFPIMIILVVATFRHQERVRQHGTDFSWSSYWGRWIDQPRPAGQTP